MTQPLNNDYFLSPWLGDLSMTQLELWRAEAQWLALCAPKVSDAPIEDTEPVEQDQK